MRRQTIIEKRIMTFKHNSRLKFFDSLRNCWQPTAVHKCDAIICLINSLFGCVAKEGCKPTELLPVQLLR